MGNHTVDCDYCGEDMRAMGTAHNEDACAVSKQTAVGTSWHSYPKVYALGHGAIAELLLDHVTVEEKVDGSQFSFGVFDGVLKVRSKGKEIDLEHPEKMFLLGVETAQRLTPQLTPGWTYSGEFLKSPKHNVNAHERVPVGNCILFDVRTGEEQYLARADKEAEASRLGLEVTPLLYEGLFTAEMIESFLDRDSVLGGCKVEGFVVKNYTRFGRDKKCLMGKVVRSDFKERHAKEWDEAKVDKSDIIHFISVMYNTKARREKAVQHLRDAGLLTETPRDIGALLKEYQSDLRDECETEIKDLLFKWAWPLLSRSVVKGLPQWYKERLLTSAIDSIPKQESSDV